MEMTLKMGAFEALDENEMLAVDGGSTNVSRAVRSTGITVAAVWGIAITAAGMMGGCAPAIKVGVDLICGAAVTYLNS